MPRFFVTHSNDFYLGIHPVTFAEFDAYCEATGKEKQPDRDWGRGQRPAIYISWYEAVEYCNWRSREEGLQEVYAIDPNRKDPGNTSGYDKMKWTVAPDWGANGYRLPTEAEWEFAARQRGEKVRFGNGKGRARPEEINFNCQMEHQQPYSETGPFLGKTSEVMRFSPNRLALYDMSGNVAEWCWDWYDENYYRCFKPNENYEHPPNLTICFFLPVCHCNIRAERCLGLC